MRRRVNGDMDVRMGGGVDVAVGVGVAVGVDVGIDAGAVRGRRTHLRRQPVGVTALAPLATLAAALLSLAAGPAAARPITPGPSAAREPVSAASLTAPHAGWHLKDSGS